MNQLPPLAARAAANAAAQAVRQASPLTPQALIAATRMAMSMGSQTAPPVVEAPPGGSLLERRGEMLRRRRFGFWE